MNSRLSPLIPSRLAGLALAALTVSGATLTAQQTVTLYFDSSYRGPAISLPLPPLPGMPMVLPGGFQDQVTSLRWNLDPNVVLTFYENSNLTGREYTVVHSQPRSGGDANVGSYYNDKFSSLTWQRVDPADGWVRFYTNANFGGYQLTRYLPASGERTVSIKDLGYNDQVDSIRWDVPRDRTVMCFDEDPVGGRALPLINSGQVTDLNTQFSGLHHDKFSTFRVMNGQRTATFADRDAPLDRVCQLSSHNAHCSPDHGWVVWYNQTMSMFEQLDYGARVLQLDVREQNGALHLTHGSWSQSIAQRGGSTPERLGPFITGLHNWLQVHRDEVVFLVFENYTGSTLSAALRGSVIGNMLYRPDGLSWPSINQLAALNRRVIVLDSSSATSELYEWDWEVQNGYSSFGDSAARSESDPIDNQHRSLYLMNHISGSSTPTVWFGNSPNDLNQLYSLALQNPQLPNFINIDGIQMADHAGLEACRVVNELHWGLRPPATSFEFQDGCGLSLSTRDTPRLGGVYRVDAPGADFVLIGLSDRVSAGQPLPRSLMPFSNCLLRVSPDVMLAPNASGQVGVPVPTDTRLVGVPLFSQSFDLTAGTIRMSNGLGATLSR